ncbi:MAG TPA: hypothetical protein VGN39_05405 [Terriglobales bacterium]|jgi:hypothetical protein|nr:hypothetical protein [Terriglobales bacterium]
MRTIPKLVAIVFLLYGVLVPATGEDFPLKRVPQFTYLVDYEASWSPDGRQIVLISNRHGGMKVHILDARSEGGGSDMRQITSGRMKTIHPPGLLTAVRLPSFPSMVISPTFSL